MKSRKHVQKCLPQNVETFWVSRFEVHTKEQGDMVAVRGERDRYYIIAEKGFFQGRGDVSSFLKLPFLFTSWESFWNRTPRKDPHQ